MVGGIGPGSSILEDRKEFPLLCDSWASLVAQMVKSLPARWET